MISNRIQNFSLILLLLFTCTKKSENQVLDLIKSPTSVELFAPGVVSTGLYERDMAISPDGREIIYSLGDYKQNRRCLVLIRESEGAWSKPKILPFSGRYQDIEPFFSNEGNRLFFASDRPISDTSGRTDYNIWYVDRNQSAWKNPVPVNENINTEGDEYYPSVSSNGNLYFTATRKDGIGREDIYYSKFVDGYYQDPILLDSTINTTYFEFNAYVSPDEDLLIFSSYGRDGGFGGGDLYYSQKDDIGNWTSARNMGEKVNSNKLDYCPFVDWPRNNFYFTSERVGEMDTIWKEVEDVIKFSIKSRNGMGDIYRISLDELGIQ